MWIDVCDDMKMNCVWFGLDYDFCMCECRWVSVVLAQMKVFCPNQKLLL